MPRPSLVICDGALASTVGALLEAERCAPVVWVPPASVDLFPHSGHTHETALATVRQQAAMRGYAEVLDGAPGARVGRLVRPMGLLEAVRAAMDHACERVVWPVACGSDLDAMSEIAECALLVTRLAWLEEGSLTGPAPPVETPLLDLNDHALEEMATDLDVVPSFWLHPSADAAPTT